MEWRGDRIEFYGSALLLLSGHQIALAQQQAAEVGTVLGSSRLQLHCLACRRRGFLDAALLDQQAAELGMTLGAGRVALEPEFVFSLGQLALLGERPAAPNMRLRGNVAAFINTHVISRHDMAAASAGDASP